MSAFELLVVIVPVARREEVVDLLMLSEEIGGFTRSAAAGFSSEESRFSLRESVQGYLSQERFEIVCDPSAIDGLLESLAGLAGSDRFFYWVTPLLREGALGGAA